MMLGLSLCVAAGPSGAVGAGGGSTTLPLYCNNTSVYCNNGAIYCNATTYTA